MDDYGYSPNEITDLVQKAIERANCEVVSWRQDPRDSRHVYVTARLRVLPPETAPLQLEVLLPPARGRAGTDKSPVPLPLVTR